MTQCTYQRKGIKWTLTMYKKALLMKVKTIGGNCGFFFPNDTCFCFTKLIAIVLVILNQLSLCLIAKARIRVHGVTQP